MDAFLGLTGLLGIIISAIILIVYAIKKRPLKTISAVLAVFFIFFVAGLLLPASQKEIDSEKKETSVIEEEKKMEVHDSKEKGLLNPGDATSVLKGWLIAAGLPEEEFSGVKITKEIGTGFLKKESEKGYSFFLIPVTVKNVAKEENSLGFPTWELSDNRGYKYTSLGAFTTSLYLPEDMQLNTSGFPPGATRHGYIVFEVADDPKELYLEIRGARGSAKWKLW